jgi:outer membrane lipoprotein SlyB
MKMRKLLTMSLVALSLVGSLTAASAQAFDRSQAKQQESSQPSTPSNATDRGYLAE